MHSCWGTFEWILHDSFEAGHRIGVVAHSDDHKGRPGCAYPGASRFGALGGLTCYLAESFDRKGLVDALRKRHTYGTSGDRVRLDLKITERIELAFDVACPDAIEKVELFDGTECIDAWRHPFEEPARDDRIRVLGEGVLYRGRGSIIRWAIDTSTDEATMEEWRRSTSSTAIASLSSQKDNRSVRLETVTTGNRSGMDLSLSDAMAGMFKLDCHLGEIEIALPDLLPGVICKLDGEGLGRRNSLERCPAALETARVTQSFTVDLVPPGKEWRLYLRVTRTTAMWLGAAQHTSRERLGSRHEHKVNMLECL